MRSQNDWYLGRVPVLPIPDAEGFCVHLGRSVQDLVAFLGFRDSSAPGGIKCEGTGFFLRYKGHGYLLTARHVAKKLTGSPFAIRVNQHKGGGVLIDADGVNWHCPDDELVDLAAIRLTLSSSTGVTPLYFSDDQLLTRERLETEHIDIGDICYTVGLFHFVSGHSRNTPFAHTGTIALIPPEGEKIPVGNDAGDVEFVEAYLIESHAINGASGSPVLVRPALTLGIPDPQDPKRETGLLGVENKVFMLGLFQAAWFLPPDAPVAETVRALATDKVPVGIGVVVPAYKIVELLENEPVKQERKKHQPTPAQLASVSASADKTEQLPANSSHKEDFTRLLNVAAKKREPKD